MRQNTESNPNAAAEPAAQDMRTLLINSMKDIYWAENALLKALPKMMEQASSANLASVIKDHIAQTQNQVVRLENAFGLLGSEPEAKKCEAMAGLLKEGDALVAETAAGPLRDAAIIAASQKIEHYEMATYGTLCAFAKALGENDAAKLLAQNLAEEKAADMLLNDVAYNAVNVAAAALNVEKAARKPLSKT